MRTTDMGVLIMSNSVQLSQGGGASESNALVNDLFYKYFSNEILLKSEDAAVLQVNKNIAFTTDSYTVNPIFFKGGDIGKISIAGTTNDLAMMGAKPLYLSCGFIIEEGFAYDDLEKIVKSMAGELKNSGAKIVCGDTKVVPRGAVDKIFINTSGIGEIKAENISSHNLEEDDVILVSRDIGAHGATILSEREELSIKSDLKSDCTSLWSVVEKVLENNITPSAMRDATRGGMAAVLNEWAESSNVCIELQEDSIPVQNEVKGICEIFGFEPTDFANEGTFVLSVKKSYAQKTLEALKEYSQNAAIIGKVTTKRVGKVIINTAYGSSRYLDMPKGELLPRIC